MYVDSVFVPDEHITQDALQKEHLYTLRFRSTDEAKVYTFLGSRRGFLLFRDTASNREVAVMETSIHDITPWPVESGT